jgi:hypothetical protein
VSTSERKTKHKKTKHKSKALLPTTTTTTTTTTTNNNNNNNNNNKFKILCVWKIILCSAVDVHFNLNVLTGSKTEI